MASRIALAFVIGGPGRYTSEIVNHVMGYGFTRRQVLGAIGYLRKNRLLNIVCPTINPLTGKKEHIFN